MKNPRSEKRGHGVAVGARSVARVADLRLGHREAGDGHAMGFIAHFRV